MADNGNHKLRILGQPPLLDDGSIAWDGHDRTALLRSVGGAISRLRLSTIRRCGMK